MGIGPSSKETTLHHFNDPLVKVISNDQAIDFMGIIVEGTPELCNHKQFVAQRAGVLVEAMRADGAIVSIDSWGNSHIDFTSVIEAIGERGIPVVGVSFVGNQASFVVTNSYMDSIIDLNKNEAGIETTVVGENTASELDAVKAVAVLKNKMRKKSPTHDAVAPQEEKKRKLVIRSFAVRHVLLSEETKIVDQTLYVNKKITENIIARYREIDDLKINIIYPQQRDLFINSVLDFSPIAAKVFGKPGEGVTYEIRGVKVMLTGVDTSGFQAANIGSSEGILKEKVRFDQNGTPCSDDIILHIDVILADGEARTTTGIMAAHRACDEIIQEIREKLKALDAAAAINSTEYYDVERKGCKKVVLVKLVSGLGCMYNTGLFPKEPGGYIGCRSIMDLENMQVAISPNEYRDGVVRSLS